MDDRSKQAKEPKEKRSGRLGRGGAAKGAVPDPGSAAAGVPERSPASPEPDPPDPPGLAAAAAPVNGSANGGDERAASPETPPEALATGEYTADAIQVLKGIEAVRKRPAMYIGDTGSRGLHHLVYEVVDNSIDEALQGHCNQIDVKINTDGSITVVDNGRGIPVGLHKETGLNALEVVMTMLHAGGKFDHKAYKVSGGLHGVGVSCVNALSEYCEVEVYREGHVWAQRYERGITATPVENRGRTDRRGTKTVFKPDPQIFEATAYNYDILANRMRELAFLNRGVRIRLFDERTDKEETFYYEGGIVAFVKYLNEGKTPIHPDVVYLAGEMPVPGQADADVKVMAEVAFQFNDGFNEQLYSYVNNINTIEGGTHLSGFRAAITRQFNRYAQQSGAVKGDKLPTGEDYREGVACVLSVKVPDPQFEGQTKTKLGNREVQGIVEAIVNDKLGTWVEENPAAARAICQKAVHSAKVREAMRKARDLARKSALSAGNLPGKLWDCSSRDFDETELFIVEGDSAGGSAKGGRDRRFQAILPIRGKILNVEKASLDKLLGHEEIKTIISALGTGFHDEFDIGKLRYGKVIVMTDADVDGSHIRTLLLTFFYRHMMPIIDAGRVYAAEPPLYRVKKKKDEHYVHDEREMKSRLLKLGIEGTALESHRTGRRLEGKDLASFLDTLSALEEHVRYIAKKGVPFERYLEARRKDRDKALPLYLVRTTDGERFLYDDLELEAFVADLRARTGEEPKLKASEETPEETPEPDERSLYWKTEFLGKREIEETLRRVEETTFTPDNYFPAKDPQAAPRYTIHAEGEKIPVGSLREILEAVRKVGQKGLEITRYKGLGEMNPEQLWETTMDPAQRSLTRIRLVDAAKANHIFTILMGTGVEPRREFIERHALDVKDLDI